MSNLTPISESEIIKRFKPPGEPPPGSGKEKSGGISVFPNAPLDMPTETFTKALNKREENRKELLRWMRENFKEAIEFGRIHLDERCRYARAGSPGLCRDITHYSRPMLYKAGAERIIGVLGLTAHYPSLHQFELACVHRQEIREIVLKCELKTSSGTVVSEGAGARHIRQDNWNLNTSIKMACRSALVDAAIRVAGLSGVFIATHRKTLTDVGVCSYEFRYMGDRPLPQRVDCHQTDLTKGGDRHRHEENPITRKQLQLVQHIAGRKGYSTDILNSRCQELFGKHLNDLNKVEASRFINTLINNNG